MRIIPFQIRNFRLNRADETDIDWIDQTLDLEGAKLGTRVSRDESFGLVLEW